MNRNPLKQLGTLGQSIWPDYIRRDLIAGGGLRLLYDKTDGKDGYVSLEVNPHLAHDTNGTVEEAQGVLERLPELGISIDSVTRQLEDEGVEKFNKPFDKMMAVLRG